MDEGLFFNELVFDILSVISCTPGIKKTEIETKVSGARQTTYNKIKILIEDGFLIETRHGLHNVKRYHITDHGLQVLQAMLHLRSIVQGPGDTFRSSSGKRGSVN